MGLVDDKKEKIELDIITIKDDIISKMNYDWLNQIRNYLVKKNYRLSFAYIIYQSILTIDLHVKNLYKNSRTSFYFEFPQWEWDSLYKICIKANELGIDVYPKINRNNNLDYLTELQVNDLLTINDEAVNYYFDLLLKHNLNYVDDEKKFLNMMYKFGEKHNMTEKELTKMCEDAYKKNINLALFTSLDEVEEIYKELYPEA